MGKRGPARKPAIERLMRRIVIDPSTECWLWQGKLRNGYGKLMDDDHRLRPVHRLSYELARGPVDAGLHVHHECGVKNCCNPDHLRPVTPAEHLECHDTHRVGGMAIARRWREATACKRGHEYTPDNTHIDAHGKRWCRACGRIRANALWAQGRYSRQRKEAA